MCMLTQMSDETDVYVFCLPIERMWVFRKGVAVSEVLKKVGESLKVDPENLGLLQNEGRDPIKAEKLTEHARVYVSMTTCSKH